MENKRILFIAPLFFDYYSEIINELTIMGYEVDYICDAPNNSNITKAIGRINKRLIYFSTRKYFKNNVWKKIRNNKYNKVFVICGMTFSFSPNMLEKIKNNNPEADFIIYQWDSENNLPFVNSIHKYFDRLYTFDRVDYIKNNKYSFLPLFYTRTYEEIGNNNHDYKYGCSYVGTAHPQKYKDINTMSNSLQKIIDNQFIYHYMPSKLKYFYHKLLSPEYKKARFRDFKTNKLSSKDMMHIFENSKIILDAPQSGQTGLTIRTIECLGAKRKLITTNKEIEKYDFYNKQNILIYEGEIDKNSSFFTNEYVDIDNHIYQKYSLRNWLEVLLKNKKERYLK